MEAFEMYKLKAAGLTNEQVLRILAICQEGEPLPPLEEMAKIARYRSIIRFVEQYRQLDEEQLRTDFERFPSLSIFDSDYPESLMQIYNPPCFALLSRKSKFVSRTENSSSRSQGDEQGRSKISRKDYPGTTKSAGGGQWPCKRDRRNRPLCLHKKWWQDDRGYWDRTGYFLS